MLTSLETQVTVKHLTNFLQSHAHKLCMDNVFSLPNLFNDLTKRSQLLLEKLSKKKKAAKPVNKQLKQDDIHTRTRDYLKTNTWYTHTDKCAELPINAYFYSKHGNARKKRIIRDYKQHIGHTDSGDRMTHNHLIPCQTWN
jgi:hypothetical protein